MPVRQFCAVFAPLLRGAKAAGTLPRVLLPRFTGGAGTGRSSGVLLWPAHERQALAAGLFAEYWPFTAHAVAVRQCGGQLAYAHEMAM
ncbi:hypothetical protein NPIL_488441 [Nephila pilipes]|uniref:Uncharacterized protein n=1 Tax=Nephila pilipes TaxID=299642 RepID=A0A8X6P1L1_NEPPI|nr:hypothetical protein NPIL_488441 [Nephila pilipes]